MRRADRLFDIIQFLRRKKMCTARDLAERLEVSERTIYRDISDLIGSGVPIRGEAGVGYILGGGFDMPPLMFTQTELEAMVLGARIVETWADAELGDAARNALTKIEAVVPESLRRQMETTPLVAPPDHFQYPLTIDPGQLRRAVTARRKVKMVYLDLKDEPSVRQVRPLALSFYGPIWLLTAWCELRDDFRNFRLDRMSSIDVREETFRQEPGKTINDYLKQERERAKDRQR